MRWTGGLVWIPTLNLIFACGSEPLPEAKTATVEPPSAPLTTTSEAAPSDEELPGLDADAVVGVVSRYEGAVSGCHVIGYSGASDHAGSVTLAWTINPDGSVRKAHVADSSFGDDEFHRCLVAVIEGLEFPEAPGSTDVGAWRFKFRSRGNEGGDSSSTAFSTE